MASTLVIKVKYGETLRRFNAQVTEDGKLDLDMNGLCAKILGLFNFPADADIALSYLDEDGDVVALVDDNDLLDVTKQNLKFLKINVHVNNDFAKSSGSSTPMRSPRVQNPVPDINKAIADALKSVPDPVRETLSKLSLDLAAKAASSNNVVAELVDCFSKMGQSLLNQNQPSQSDPVTTSVPNGARPENVTRGVGVTVKPVPAPVDLNLDPDQAVHNGDGRKETSGQNTVHLSKKPFGLGAGFASGSSSSASPFAFANECPFSYTPMENDFPAPPPSRRWNAGHSDSSAGMFHRGVQCDGCGVHPITGPRYKSKVLDDYDLCSICFARMGNDSDYIKMDKPVSYRHPRSFKGLHNSAYLIPPLSNVMRHCGMKSHRSKLDSRFIMDVNVLDGTVMSPSTDFTKIWRMRNSGSVSWPQGSRLVWIGGDKFSHEVFSELEIPVSGLAVDGELDVAVDFTSPELPGRYISYWRMASPSGTKFGQRVWVLIQVDAAKKESHPSGGFNLNLPPNGVPDSAPVSAPPAPILVSAAPTPTPVSALPAPPTVSEKAVEVVEQPEKDQEMNFPINNSLLVGEGVSASAPESSSSVSYPIIDLSEALGFTEAPAGADVTPSPEEAKEKSLLDELEQMGFKQVDLNKEVLRLNEYNLEQSVDDLCGVSEWDPILEELQEMGFCDENKNKQLLKKNNGSIRRVVMDLLSNEKA